LTRLRALKNELTGSILSVEGGGELRGSVGTSGFKHSLVTIFAAALAANSRVRVQNCPDIAETQILTTMAASLGAIVDRTGDSLAVDASGLSTAELDPHDAERIHGSVYLLPALLGRFGVARLPPSGGCQIGDGRNGRRPMRHYADVFERFGATVSGAADDSFTVSARRLNGCEIDLLDYADRALRSGPLYSGATKTALLTAAVAYGTTVLHNPYPKPDVTDLVDVLRELGLSVERTADGSLVLHGRGPDALDRPVVHTLIPDLIEVVTWVCAGALLARRPFRVTGADMDRARSALAPEFAVLAEMGVHVDHGPREVVVHPAERLRAVDVTVTSHGVFSDSQPFLALLAAHAAGESVITETVWSGRFGYAEGLRTLGVHAEHSGATLRVRGPWTRERLGDRVHAGDLRSAAVLVLAALAVPGRTEVSGVDHLHRGYADLPGALRAVGAEIDFVEGKVA
jgi:UDP-N-acetylglucosamine 1-carboxyvinyltransferase